MEEYIEGFIIYTIIRLIDKILSIRESQNFINHRIFSRINLSIEYSRILTFNVHEGDD